MSTYQGRLDGLCGPYAIVNAFEHCGIKNNDDVFQTACSALTSRRWPEVLWNGTTLGDLQRMIKRCRDLIDGASVIRTSYPFSRNTPADNKTYWKRFDDLFKEKERTCCAIIGLTRPSYHWIVAYREGGTRVSFLDTDPYRPYVRKNQSMLHAGSRNGNPNKWIIDRKELILFEVE